VQLSGNILIFIWGKKYRKWAKILTAFPGSILSIARGRGKNCSTVQRGYLTHGIKVACAHGDSFEYNFIYIFRRLLYLESFLYFFNCMFYLIFYVILEPDTVLLYS
jgi:hypothetical protein